jgi:hypothetical protein
VSLKRKLFFASLLALLPVLAQAANSDEDAGAAVSQVEVKYPRQYFAILPGYFYADKGHDASRDGVTISGIYGYQFAPKWEGEVNLFGTNINTGPGINSDFYQTGVTLDLGYNLIGDRSAFTVFAIGGVGGVYDDVIPNHYDSVNFMADGGLGFVTGRLFGIGLKIRGEARAIYDMYTSATQKGQLDARASIGLEFPFGGEKIKVVRVPQPVQIVQAPPPPPSHHTCPYVLPGTKVDQFNCPVAGQTIVLHGVHFAFNSDRLTLNAKTVLNNAVRMMNGAPKMTVEVAGTPMASVRRRTTSSCRRSVRRRCATS